jgi:hypothetical protein
MGHLIFLDQPKIQYKNSLVAQVLPELHTLVRRLRSKKPPFV